MMFYVSCCLSSPGTGNIAAAYTLRFAAANLINPPPIKKSLTANFENDLFNNLTRDE